MSLINRAPPFALVNPVARNAEAEAGNDVHIEKDIRREWKPPLNVNGQIGKPQRRRFTRAAKNRA